ncbi:unnamed protein product [Caenorhabditis auriculariae]|uniref:Uncharacterized protein n=1 Tax=Caenorhabditis auriculariae TaxID=2777116 RepID=A0A8S1HDN4_9PELO|nr:unnamed protein product [Caenorhabditis auriculariae]
MNSWWLLRRRGRRRGDVMDSAMDLWGHPHRRLPITHFGRENNFLPGAHASNFGSPGTSNSDEHLLTRFASTINGLTSDVTRRGLTLPFSAPITDLLCCCFMGRGKTTQIVHLWILGYSSLTSDPRWLKWII